MIRWGCYKLRLGVCLSFCLILQGTAGAREFTSKKMEAEPVNISGGKVFFTKEGGKKFSYALDQLSEEDQAFLKEWAKTAQKYELTVTRAQGVVCCYSIFPKRNDRFAKDKVSPLDAVHGKVKLKTIPKLGKIDFQTQSVRLESKNMSTATTLMKWDESFAGANFHFFIGDRLVASHNIGAYESNGTPKPEDVKFDPGKGEDDASN